MDEEQSKTKAVRRAGALLCLSSMARLSLLSPWSCGLLPCSRSLLGLPETTFPPGLQAALTPPDQALSLLKIDRFSNLLAALRLPPAQGEEWWQRQGNRHYSGISVLAIALSHARFIHRLHQADLSERDRAGLRREELKKKVLPCMSRILSRVVVYSRITLPYWEILVFLELLHSHIPAIYFTTSHSVRWYPRLGDTYSHWQTKNDPGCPQTLYRELWDSSVCPCHTEQPLPLSPSPGHGTCCRSALDAEQDWELSDQQPVLRKPSRSPHISICSAVKTDTFYRPWHLSAGSARARARNSGEGRAPHQYLQVCQVGNVFLVSASVTYADVSSLLPALGDSSMLPFSLGDMMPIFSLDT